jgi:hypothetical protein
LRDLAIGFPQHPTSTASERPVLLAVDQQLSAVFLERVIRAGRDARHRSGGFGCASIPRREGEETMKTRLWWRASVMAVTTTILAGIIASPASAVKPAPPGCSIQVTGDGTDSVTFDATFVGVPKRGTTQLTVDNTVVSDPFTTIEVGTHDTSCQILDRRGGAVDGSSTVTATVVPPATYECAITWTQITLFTVQVDWSVTVTNPDGTVFDVRVCGA